MSYVLYKFRFRQGNAPIEQSVVEVLDTGKAALNRDAAQALAEVWLHERALNRGADIRFVDAEPFVAVSERPVEPIPVPVKEGVKPITARA